MRPYGSTMLSIRTGRFSVIESKMALTCNLRAQMEWRLSKAREVERYGEGTSYKEGVGLQGMTRTIWTVGRRRLILNLESRFDDARIWETKLYVELPIAIPQVDCSHKPEVKLNVSDFNDIVDDTDFSMKLAKEESVIVSQVMNRSTIRQRVYKYLKRKADGLKTWIRVSYSTEPKRLEESIQRM
ncbi:tyrosine/nicotianamine aminotransferase, pyridoxal phosphate-dependent transferase [Tanacetum coccineum]